MVDGLHVCQGESLALVRVCFRNRLRDPHAIILARPLSESRLRSCHYPQIRIVQHGEHRRQDVPWIRLLQVLKSKQANLRIRLA